MTPNDADIRIKVDLVVYLDLPVIEHGLPSDLSGSRIKSGGV